MKKILALVTTLALSFSLVACGSTDNDDNSDVIDSTNYKVGIGSYTTTENSSSVAGENGKGVVKTTYATVIFDSNNIIKKVYIDEVESKVYFDAKGQIVKNGNNTAIKSKRELGDSYNMKAASPIGKEWYEQVNSLESYLVGKNIDEISKAVIYGGSYSTKDDYADSLGNDTSSSDNIVNNAINGAENIAGEVTSGVESIADNIANGAENIIDGNNNGDRNDDKTAGGMTDNIDGKVDNSNSNSEMNSSSSSSSVSSDYSDALNWEEDLKSSVTINLTNIQRALQKAYANAQ